MKWKYKIDLEKNNAITEIERIIKSKFPKDLLKYIKSGNAATPEKNRMNICGKERVVAAMLSFNKEDDSEDVYMVMEHVKRDRVIPFALDSFGNLFVYFVENKIVGFWNHEESTYAKTDMSVETFFESLL